MDHRRFDELTRWIGIQRSRRSTLRGVVGALIGAGSLARAATVHAQGTDLPPGARCTATEQCSQAGGVTVCDNNGYDEDGPLNCCRPEGQTCEVHAWCCGAYHCVGGVCVDDRAAPTASSTAMPTIEPTSGQTAAGALGLGQPCGSTAECAPSAAGVVVCGDNTIADDGPTNCCLQRGGGCTGDSVCCGGLTCTNGFCGSAPEAGNLGPGDVCLAVSDCSQSLGPATCGGAKNSDDGQNRCCLIEATSCSTDAECCGTLVCAENGISSDGGLNCCSQAGAPCQGDGSCCAFLFCISGTCQSLR